MIKQYFDVSKLVKEWQITPSNDLEEYFILILHERNPILNIIEEVLLDYIPKINIYYSAIAFLVTEIRIPEIKRNMSIIPLHSSQEIELNYWNIDSNDSEKNEIVTLSYNDPNMITKLQQLIINLLNSKIAS